MRDTVGTSRKTIEERYPYGQRSLTACHPWSLVRPSHVVASRLSTNSSILTSPPTTGNMSRFGASAAQAGQCCGSESCSRPAPTRRSHWRSTADRAIFGLAGGRYGGGGAARWDMESFANWGGNRGRDRGTPIVAWTAVWARRAIVDVRMPRRATLSDGRKRPRDYERRRRRPRPRPRHSSLCLRRACRV